MKIINVIILLISLHIQFVGCSSSRNESKRIENKFKTKTQLLGNDSTRVHIAYFSPPRKDSTIIFTFYKITNSDTLNLHPVSVLYSDSLVHKLRIPEIAFRAGVDGNVIVDFNLDTNGTAKNIRILSGIGAGMEQAVVEAIGKFRFNIWQNYKEIELDNNSILLIAYFKLSLPAVKVPPERVIK